ncbi:MAG TPA: HNH endonuclease signature motif containing protein [Microbacterium sp.]|nr:HNH endonuclease signature motif containing protein [Microbacterium sp.]
MYSLHLPSASASDTYTTAVGTIRKELSRIPYTTAKPSVLASCEAFDAFAAASQLHLAVGSDFDVAGLAGADMVALYDNQFSSRVGTAAIRNSIKNAAINALCPYCGEGYASELDHFLPKTVFAGTTVHPANLIPCCGDCNFAKRDYMPDQDSPAVLHPYFDGALFKTPWLSARLDHGALDTPKVRFVIELCQPNAELEARLNQHIKIFKLQKRFRAWAAQELNNFEILLASDEGQSMGLEQAQQHLRRNAISLSGGRVNSWERATYTAMAESHWYLSDHLGLTSRA